MANLVNVPGIENVSDAFKEKVTKMAADLETDPNFLMAIMSFESGHSFSPKKKSPVSGATGLIQFMPKTAVDLGTSIQKLEKMTAEEQLDVVAQYFKRFKGRMKTLEDAYMAVLFPKAVGKGSDFVLFKKPSIQFRQNKGLDIDGDGSITVREAAQRVRAGLGVNTTLAEVIVLKRGMKGSEVDSLQDEMIDLGYMTLEEKKSGPGNFGPITERAVKKFQSDNELNDKGTFDLATQAAVRQLNEGVQFGSKGGVVLPMQKRLVEAKKITQAELNTGPGKFGELTRKALIGFQLDNHLEPNGILTDETYRLLYKIGLPKKSVPAAGDNAEINVVLAERGEGFRTFLREPEGATQFGTQLTINALIDIAHSWFLIHPEVPIQFGHISRRGGGPFFSTVKPGTLAHRSHKDGRTIDIRPIRKDNVMAATDFKSNNYDPVRTKELVMLIREKHPKVDIIFNDPKFIKAKLSRFFEGHHNHLHVQLR